MPNETGRVRQSLACICTLWLWSPLASGDDSVPSALRHARRILCPRGGCGVRPGCDHAVRFVWPFPRSGRCLPKISGRRPARGWP